MKKKFWETRIPTLFGLLIIGIGLGVTTLLVNQGVLLRTNAGPTQQPKNVRISNVTENSFTVSYVTDDKISGSLNYGKDKNLGQSGLDDRDQQKGNLNNYNVHSITVRNLTTLTKYYFAITSGPETYMNNDQPFEVTTGPNITSNPTQVNPITGKLILQDGSPPLEAIIYLTTNNSQVVSFLIKPDGSYVFPLNSVRNSDLSEYFSFTLNNNLEMLAYGDLKNSNILLSLDKARPVPAVTLGNDYDFRSAQEPTQNNPINLESFPSFTSTSSAGTNNKNTPQILTPEQNQGFTDVQPVFKGTGIPNENVQIIIHSDEKIDTKTSIDNTGNWSYRPSTPLTPGNHTITIITKSAQGVLKTITKSFTVYAQGSQVNQTATPTAALTPIITVTLTPTRIPTQIATVIPILTITSTPIPTPTITSQIIEEVSTFSANLSPTIVLSPTGNPSIMTVGIVALVITLIGGLLFLLARGSFSIL